MLRVAFERVWGADGRAAWQRRHLVMWWVVLVAGCNPGSSPTAPTSGAPAPISAPAPAMAMTLAPDAASTIADSPLTGDTRTVLAATTTPLMMVTEPGGAINGEIMTTQPVVRMTDAAGHTVTSFTGNVMAWAHTGHTVSNTRTVAAVAGVATFTDLAITGRAEPLTLRFTTDSGVAVHSAPFPLAIGRAAKAMIATQPSGAVSGTVLTTQPVVRITDHGGNTVTTYTGNVSITAETGPGNFSGTKTVAAVNGVASFTDLALTANTQFQLTTNNLFTVTFTADTWPPVTSNPIALTLPAPVTPAPVTPAPAPVAACATGGVCAVGDTGPGGGLVFLISGGLTYEMAPKDWGANEETGIRWCSNFNPVSTRTAVGTGSANTTAMLTSAGAFSACTVSAPNAARAYRGGGKSDWFLPSQDELNAMCIYSRNPSAPPTGVSCSELGGQNAAFASGAYGFATDDYWSSSQIDADYAWYQMFVGGLQFYDSKFIPLRVRPVRAF